MNRWQKTKPHVEKFVAWTPADIFCSICPRPISSDTYSVFRLKIQRSNLRVLFGSILVTGILLDILTILYFTVLQPNVYEAVTIAIARLSVFTLLSCLNFAHHLVFLLLHIKIDYNAKYQYLISTVSLILFAILIHQYQVLNHPHSPVQVWVTIGLLQTLVVVFYYQGSFVSSMIFWIITTVWISSADNLSYNLQVLICDTMIV